MVLQIYPEECYFFSKIGWANKGKENGNFMLHIKRRECVEMETANNWDQLKP